jgi:hypothetical protein
MVRWLVALAWRGSEQPFEECKLRHAENQDKKEGFQHDAQPKTNLGTCDGQDNTAKPA